MRTNFVTYRGLRICVLDFTNVSDDDTALAAIEEAKSVITR